MTAFEIERVEQGVGNHGIQSPIDFVKQCVLLVLPEAMCFTVSLTSWSPLVYVVTSEMVSVPSR